MNAQIFWDIPPESYLARGIYLLLTELALPLALFWDSTVKCWVECIYICLRMKASFCDVFIVEESFKVSDPLISGDIHFVDYIPKRFWVILSDFL